MCELWEEKAMISISHAKQFYALWSSWLGEGGQPVPQEVAQERADVCTGRCSGVKCPMNVEKGLTQLLSEGVASVVHRQLEIKHKMRLHVENEKDLNICAACDCVLSLKIYTPIKHILDNTDTNGLHPNCWILKEKAQCS